MIVMSPTVAVDLVPIYICVYAHRYIDTHVSVHARGCMSMSVVVVVVCNNNNHNRDNRDNRDDRSNRNETTVYVYVRWLCMV